MNYLFCVSLERRVLALFSPSFIIICLLDGFLLLNVSIFLEIHWLVYFENKKQNIEILILNTLLHT